MRDKQTIREGRLSMMQAEFNKRSDHATLPAAKPVAWRIVGKLDSGSTTWKVVEHEHQAREEAKSWEKMCAVEVHPLYATPHAPSVAVKALSAIANYRSHSRLDSDENAEAMERIAKDALSAQVQDVAGWQDISTAPQDGTTFLAIMAKAYSPRATLCKVEDGKLLSPSQGEKFVAPGWNQWWPTHWMPLPAAPAKQEGKP